MNIKQKIKINKNSFIVLIIAMMVVSALLRLLTPKKTPIPTTDFINTNANQTTTDFTNTTYIGSIPEFPKKLPIVRVTQELNENKIIKNLILQYNLQKNEKVEFYWKNSVGQYLYQDPYSHKYKLSIEDSSYIKGNNPDLPNLVHTAQEFITHLFPGLPLYTKTQDALLFKADFEDQQLVNFDQANLINVPFFYMIGDFKLKYNKETIDPFFVTVDKNGTITGVFFSPLFITTQTIFEKEIMPINKAIDNINNNQAAIIFYTFVDGKNLTKIELSQINFMELDKVELEYRYDEKVGLAYPFYHFSGTGIDAFEEEIFLEIITPAVETQITQ